MQHPFYFEYCHTVPVSADAAIEIREPDVKIIAMIGPDNSQPDGWNVDGLSLVKTTRILETPADRALGLRYRDQLFPMQPGTPIFAQAMAHFAEHEADNVSNQWDALRRRGEAA